MKRRFLLPVSTRTPDVNVTPLIDVVLVLLIIFMVVSPLVNEALSTHLAQAEEGTPEQATDSQIVVRVERNGDIVLDGEALTFDVYKARLAEKLEKRPPGDRGVFFDADRGSNYGRFVSALDYAKQAGGGPLGFVMRKEP